MEPRYNDLRYNDIPNITIKNLYPGKSYGKIMGQNPDVRIFNINMWIWRAKVLTKARYQQQRLIELQQSIIIQLLCRQLFVMIYRF